MKAYSDRVEALYAEQNKIDDMIHELRMKIKDEFKVHDCSQCGTTLSINRVPHSAPAEVKAIDAEVTKLRRRWDDIDTEVDRILEDVQDKVTDVFKGTVFDVYGIDLVVI
ncbi:MAG: hypothetical protein ACW99G_05015 [Candidatus Thorarchaeota archaeon]|jgi:hypothetical protein